MNDNLNSAYSDLDLIRALCNPDSIQMEYEVKRELSRDGQDVSRRRCLRGDDGSRPALQPPARIPGHTLLTAGVSDSTLAYRF